MFYLLPIFLFFLILRWDVFTDYDKWKKNIPIKHKSFDEIGTRALLLLPVIVLFCYPNFSLLRIGLSSAMVGFWWLLLFDGLYNRKRGFNWWFLGSVDKDESWWDSLQRKIPTTLLKIIKVGIPILLLAIYIYDRYK